MFQQGFQNLHNTCSTKFRPLFVFDYVLTTFCVELVFDYVSTILYIGICFYHTFCSTTVQLRLMFEIDLKLFDYWLWVEDPPCVSPDSIETNQHLNPDVLALKNYAQCKFGESASTKNSLIIQINGGQDRSSNSLQIICCGFL